MARFKAGDRLRSKKFYQGFEQLTVIGIVTKKYPKGKTKECYVCKIPNGEVHLPVSAEDNYELIIE